MRRSTRRRITNLIQDGSRSEIRSPRGVRDLLELGLTFRGFISHVDLGMLRHLSARLSEPHKDMRDREAHTFRVLLSEYPLSIPRIMQTEQRLVSNFNRLLHIASTVKIYSSITLSEPLSISLACNK